MNEPDVDGEMLSATFEQAMNGVGPDLGPLVVASARRGRSIRRRRRLTVAASVAAVAALAVGGSVALRPDGGTPPSTAAASSALPTPAKQFPQPLQKSDDGAEHLSPGSGANKEMVALTGHAAVLTLARALPPGHTSGYSGYSSLVGWTGPEMTNVAVRARLLYDDGTGPADVSVQVDGGIGALYRPGSYPPGPGKDPFVLGYDDHFSCDKVNVNGQYRYCSGSVLPDGSHLLLTERAIGDVLTRNVTLLRPDNTKVTVSAYNTAEVAGQAKANTIRDGLPLTLDQLKSAAMAAGFQEWITPEEATRAEQAIRPFHDDTPGRNMPSGAGSTTPVPSAPSPSGYGGR
ncbi:hypothetical protein [Kitasatospora aureofaciens]|uniref:hypothetical protein n=1 Tax=Kitasatospora aureofaciens TaxID=1894 RepID=UPI001C44C167|nr:hypothetical protein [Kitasatospora aureofaciens]MBV6701368.1 hypothetical protein [Kitasatospora aureofaciens]